MFDNRRSEIEIIGEILRLSRDGVRKTEILYQNNMSFLQLQNYLSFLIDYDIIKENIVPNKKGSFNKIYVTTEKGINLLEDINKLFTYFE